MDKQMRILPEVMEKYFEDIMKTALAISVIRTKPKHISGKVYAQVLNSKLTGNAEQWKLKFQGLEVELLSVKEELIKAKLKNNAFSNNTEDTYTADIEISECLTPPSSSESKFEERQCGDLGDRHANFLKSLLKERIHENGFAETCIPECCVDSLIGILDMDPKGSQPVETVLNFADEIILAVMNHEICSSNLNLTKYSKLIIRLASHKKIIKLILSKLTEQLVAFSETLRVISQDPMALQENLEKYKSIYYILWCIESILLKAKDSDSLDSVSKTLLATLEDSVLHLSKTFPLFTCYVWRIGGLISHISTENMDVEP
ncbi:meiosis-specific protein MEI4-like [Dendronephthya gigantea]|uniref:meiosis-specific protein MEI4-like n=1 Tax=Dendronephthya gigantea TaxID=151771 RepID=UPI00106C1242|nr:meiosis-specific protein MEI4-like [Dendronephthya gigantea]